MRQPPPLGNENSLTPLPDGFSHGDHAMTPEAAVVFERSRRFASNTLIVRCTVVVQCPACRWNARASDVVYGNPNNPNARFTDKALSKVMIQAVNNFKSKVPPSCEEALVKFVMSS